MTKQELIERVYRKHGLPNGLTKKAVTEVIDGLFAELGDYFVRSKSAKKNGARFTYPGFGTFAKRKRSGRIGRHPRTGLPVEIPTITTVAFAIGSELRSLLNDS